MQELFCENSEGIRLRRNSAALNVSQFLASFGIAVPNM